MREELRSELLSAYHDGELPAVDRAEVEQLLADDESARRELEELQDLSATFAAFGTENAPNGMHEAVMRRIERESLLDSSDGSKSTPSGVPATRRRSAVWVSVVAGLGTVAAALVVAARLGPRAVEHGVAESGAPGEQVEMAAYDEFDAGVESVAERSEAVELEEESAAERPVRTVLAANPTEGPDDEPAALAGAGALAKRGLADHEKHRGARSVLEFDDDLERADVGDVVRALESRDGRVAVVRLTVVDRRQGLEALQLLLARNEVARDKTAAPEEEAFDGVRDSGAALEAVYVEATEEQIARTLEQLHRFETFKSLDVGEPIALARLHGDFGAVDQTFAMGNTDALVEREVAELRLQSNRPVEDRVGRTPAAAPAAVPLDAAPGEPAPAAAPKPMGASDEPKETSQADAAEPPGVERLAADEQRAGRRAVASATTVKPSAVKDAEGRPLKFEAATRRSRQRQLQLPRDAFVERERLAESKKNVESAGGGPATDEETDAGKSEVSPSRRSQRSLPVVFVIVLDEPPAPADAAKPAKPAGDGA